MSEMLPDQEPLPTPWVERGVDIEPPQLPIVARGVDIVQVASPPIIEREPEPMVTPPGMVMVIISIALTLAIVEVLFGGMIYQRVASRRNTIDCVLEEDLVPELRSPLNVFDGVVGAGNYWEKIQDSMEMAESNHPEARTLVRRRRLPEKQRRRLIRASKQETIWVSAHKV